MQQDYGEVKIRCTTKMEQLAPILEYIQDPSMFLIVEILIWSNVGLIVMFYDYLVQNHYSILKRLSEFVSKFLIFNLRIYPFKPY